MQICFVEYIYIYSDIQQHYPDHVLEIMIDTHTISCLKHFLCLTFLSCSKLHAKKTTNTWKTHIKNIYTKFSCKKSLTGNTKTLYQTSAPWYNDFLREERIYWNVVAAGGGGASLAREFSNEMWPWNVKRKNKKRRRFLWMCHAWLPLCRKHTL